MADVPMAARHAAVSVTLSHAEAPEALGRRARALDRHLCVGKEAVAAPEPRVAGFSRPAKQPPGIPIDDGTAPAVSLLYYIARRTHSTLRRALTTMAPAAAKSLDGPSLRFASDAAAANAG